MPLATYLEFALVNIQASKTQINKFCLERKYTNYISVGQVN